MPKSKNAVVRQYLSEVSSVIVCRKGTKGFFLRELEQAISSYAEENETVTLDMLYQQFGAPERFAAHLADDKLHAELYKKAKKKARIGMWIGIGAVILAVIAIFVLP